jgi:D-galacturonate reductase
LVFVSSQGLGEGVNVIVSLPYPLRTDTRVPTRSLYTPRDGKFAGQTGYGYRSIETFVLSADALVTEPAKLTEFIQELPTIENTLNVTKILEAGRKSLDEGRVIVL